MNTTCSWSGGKDSCYALMQAINSGYVPQVLLNVLNESGKISRSHGIPPQILAAQAERIRLPIHMVASSWDDYEVKFIDTLHLLANEYQLKCVVFGDIDLQGHRDWEEKVCARVGLQAILPLWKKDRRTLVIEMLTQGIETIIVSCNEVMGERFLGRKLEFSMIDELEKMGIDPCGENGEYHTLVLNCPLFFSGIQVVIKDRILHSGYWFCDLMLA